MKNNSPQHNPGRRNARTALAALGAVSLGGLGLVAADVPAAHAKSVPVIARGACVGGGTWKLKAKHDDGRIEVEFEVDVNRNGRVFAVRITDNGVGVFAGNRTTVAPSGSFSVNRRIANRAGTDRITAKATRGTNVCTGTVRL